MNGGDQLARGQKSAQFPASEGNVSQEKWDSIFADYEPNREVKPNPAGRDCSRDLNFSGVSDISSETRV